MELSRYFALSLSELAFFKAAAFSELLKFTTSATFCQPFFLGFFRMISSSRLFGPAPPLRFPAVREVLYHSTKDACFCQLIFYTFFIFFLFRLSPLCTMTACPFPVPPGRTDSLIILTNLASPVNRFFMQFGRILAGILW